MSALGSQQNDDTPIRKGRLQAQINYWRENFNRDPCTYLPEFLDQSKFIVDEQQSAAAFQLMFNPENQFRGLYIFGYDSEFVNDKSTIAYTYWNSEYKIFQENLPTHSDFNGPFLRWVQIATLSGQVFIWDMSKFREPPKDLYNILTVQRNDVHLAVHDKTNDEIAFHRLFEKCAVNWANSKLSYVTHKETFWRCNYIDTLQVSTNNATKLHRLGYKAPANKLKSHLLYSFGYDSKESIPIGGQVWSEPLTNAYVNYMLIDAIGTLDLAILWLRHDVIYIRRMNVQSDLVAQETFDDESNILFPKSQKSSALIGRTSSTTNVPEKELLSRKNVVRSSKRGKRRHLGPDSDDDDWDDLDDDDTPVERQLRAYGQIFAPSDQPTYVARQTPTSMFLSEQLFCNLSEQRNEPLPNLYVFENLSNSDHLDINSVMSNLLKSVEQSTDTVTDMDFVPYSDENLCFAELFPKSFLSKSSDKLSISDLKTAQRASLRETATPVALFSDSQPAHQANDVEMLDVLAPSNPRPENISDVNNPLSDNFEKRVQSEFCNILRGLNNLLPQQFVEYLLEFMSPTVLNILFRQFSDGVSREFRLLLEMFLQKVNVSKTTDIDLFSGELMNWTANFENWLPKNIVTTYSAPDQKLELFCFPCSVPELDDDYAKERYFLTSGRILLEISKQVADKIGSPVIPPPELAKKMSGVPTIQRFVPPQHCRNRDGVDNPIILNLTQVNDVFRYIYSVQSVVFKFAATFRHNLSADDGSAASTSDPRNVNTTGNEIHPMLNGLLCLAFQEFYGRYTSYRVAYIMCEQARRLLVNLILGTGRNSQWRKALAHLSYMHVGKDDDPDSVISKLQQHLKTQMNFRQAMSKPMLDARKGTSARTANTIHSVLKRAGPIRHPRGGSASRSAGFGRTIVAPRNASSTANRATTTVHRSERRSTVTDQSARHFKRQSSTHSTKSVPMDCQTKNSEQKLNVPTNISGEGENRLGVASAYGHVIPGCSAVSSTHHQIAQQPTFSTFVQPTFFLTPPMCTCTVLPYPHYH